MVELEIETLARRLDRVERENGRLKLAGALVLIGMAAAMLMGQATPRKVAKVIEAEKFVLRDAGGTVRARLEILSFGKVQLVLFDKDEKPQSILGVGSDGAGLILGGKEGTTFLSTTLLLFSGKDFKIRLGMNLFPPQEPGLIMAGSDGKHRAKLILGDDNAPALRLFDPDGKVIWKAP